MRNGQPNLATMGPIDLLGTLKSAAPLPKGIQSPAAVIVRGSIALETQTLDNIPPNRR